MNIKLLPFNLCPYPELFQDTSSKIGHVRADHDGHRWWTTWWPANEHLQNDGLKDEINRVCGCLLETLLKNGLPSITAYCEQYPQTAVGEPSAHEYNFFVDGAACGYWVRLIARPRDYNLYLHCFVKSTETGGVNNER